MACSKACTKLLSNTTCSTSFSNSRPSTHGFHTMSWSFHLIRFPEAMVNFVELDSTTSVLVLLAPHGRGRLCRKTDTNATDVLVYLTCSSLLLTVAVRWLLAGLGPSCRKLLRNQQLASVSYLSLSIAADTTLTTSQHFHLPPRSQL